MQKTIHKVVPQREVDEPVGLVCDMCGVGSDYLSAWTNTKDDLPNRAVVRISLEETRGYEECGRSKEWNVDLCPDCFKTKLLPWLRNQGCKVWEYDSDSGW